MTLAILLLLCQEIKAAPVTSGPHVVVCVRPLDRSPDSPGCVSLVPCLVRVSPLPFVSCRGLVSTDGMIPLIGNPARQIVDGFLRSAASPLAMVSSGNGKTVDVDVIELNHVYSLTENRDDFGHVKYGANFVASYYLAWEQTTEGLHVRDWVKADGRCTLDRDTLTVVSRKQVVRIRGRVVREVESWSDRERDDQATWPLSRRRVIEGLRR